MNWNPEMWSAHYTWGQILASWLVQLPIYCLVFLYFVATVEGFIETACYAWGYDTNARLTTKSALKVAPITISVLAMQAITLVILFAGLTELATTRKT